MLTSHASPRAQPRPPSWHSAMPTPVPSHILPRVHHVPLLAQSPRRAHQPCPPVVPSYAPPRAQACPSWCPATLPSCPPGIRLLVPSHAPPLCTCVALVSYKATCLHDRVKRKGSPSGSVAKTGVSECVQDQVEKERKANPNPSPNTTPDPTPTPNCNLNRTWGSRSPTPALLPSLALIPALTLAVSPACRP